MAEGADAADWDMGTVRRLKHAARIVEAAGHAPIEINPDVAALLDRLEGMAKFFGNPMDADTFFPSHVDDVRRACELIRFGSRATGQPDAGNMEDDSR
jgi:hypothetical protein